MKVKNGLKKTLACLLAVVLMLTGVPLAGIADLDLSGVADWFSTTAQAAEYSAAEDNLTYTVENSKATITDCKDSISGAFVIPSTIGGYPVTAIDIEVFYYCQNLTSVTIPDSVTSIGGYAFYGCTGLTSITIPDSVTSIGVYAFDGTDWYNSQPDGDVYAGKVYYKYKGKMPENTSIEIEAGTKGIAGSAFKDCAGLTSIIIPNSVTSIGDDAFSGCTNLTRINWNAENVSDFGYYDNIFFHAGTAEDGIDVVFGDNVKSIPAYAFRNVSSIKSVTIGNSVTSIGNEAFRGCTGLTKINWNAENVSDFSYNVFIFSNAGTAGDGINVVLGDNVKSIPAHLFYDGSSNYVTPKIKSVTIGNSVTSIGSSAFCGCTGLTSITIGNSVTSIGISAFDGTAWYNAQPFGDVYAGKVYYKYKGTMLENTSIEIKDGTKGIAGGAFRDCKGLIDVTIPNSVTNIGNYAFDNCTGLIDITIPDNVTRIGDYAFHSCNKLAGVVVPDSVKEIGNSAFGQCIELSNVILGDNIEFIDEYTFSNTKISQIIIPDSVTSLIGGAFCSCDSLTTVIIGSGIETIHYGTFQNCPNLTTIKIKKGLKSIEKDAFNGIKSIPDIFFEGSEEEWKAISIDQSNDMILRANMYYNADLSHEHSYTETVKEATCTEDGLKTFTCSCGRSYTEKIPATGHRFETVVVEPTCISIGYETSTCKNCGLSYFVKTLPATGHNFVSNTVKPTCISLGYETRTCQNCGECQFVRAIPATGHTKTIVKGKEATCIENGLTDGVECAVCGVVLEEQKVIPAKGHKEETIKGKDATCTESGLTEGKKCTVCGTITVKQEEVPALGHDFVIDVEAKDPTCTESGTTEGKHCTRCDYKVEAEVIEPLGHADANNDGKCDRCGEETHKPVNPPKPDPSANCTCACHKTGIANFFFKIGLFFQKIFKTNRSCKCGVSHY